MIASNDISIVLCKCNPIIQRIEHSTHHMVDSNNPCLVTIRDVRISNTMHFYQQIMAYKHGNTMRSYAIT